MSDTTENGCDTCQHEKLEFYEDPCRSCEGPPRYIDNWTPKTDAPQPTAKPAPAVDPRRADLAERVLVSMLTSEANVLEQFWPDAAFAAEKAVLYADALIAELDRPAKQASAEVTP